MSVWPEGVCRVQPVIGVLCELGLPLELAWALVYKGGAAGEHPMARAFRTDPWLNEVETCFREHQANTNHLLRTSFDCACCLCPEYLGATRPGTASTVERWNLGMRHELQQARHWTMLLASNAALVL